MKISKKIKGFIISAKIETFDRSNVLVTDIVMLKHKIRSSEFTIPKNDNFLPF